MVPVKKWPLRLNTPAQLAVMFVIYLAFFWKTELDWGWNTLAALAINVGVSYLWCAEDRSGRYVKACRTLEAGDPTPWVLFRWMDIAQNDELYLRRLYVFRCPKFGIMLHWIRKEDDDRDALHDHPWVFWRFIVSGGYVETVAYPAPYGKQENDYVPDELLPAKDVTHKRWRASKFPTGAFHRISSVKPGTVSFVINGKKSNRWGFFVPGTGKVPWRDYRDGAR